MKLKIFAHTMLFILLLMPFPVLATEWAKTYGGSGSEDARSIQQTADGGYIVAGSTASSGAGSSDAWVLKLNSNGNVTWQKTYGGSDNDYALFIQQTADGGYIVVGQTESFGAGSRDAWVLKLDSNGNVTWQKTYGGSGNEYGYSIQQTPDGGYIVAWGTASFGAGLRDAWVLKLDSNGNVTWQKAYGGSGYDFAGSIQQTADGGYIVEGYADSFGAGSYDAWVLKLDSNGNVTWQKTYGGSGSEVANSIQQTADGGYIVVGQTDSFGAGSYDAWVLKLDSNGNVTWQKTYGGSGSEDAHSIKQPADGGYMVAGATDSFGAGSSDAWVLKLDSNGEISGCDIIKTSNAPVSNTSVAPGNSSIVGGTSYASIDSTNIQPNVTSAVVSTICSTTPSECSTWTDVISKYNLYVSGQALWSDVITCYNQYVTP